MLVIVSICKNSNNIEYLKGINFEVYRGQKVAFVGLSGSGKSTLFKILLGLLPDYKGEIFINKVELKNIPVGILRKIITLIPQEDYFFDGDLKENLVFDRRDLDSEIIENIFRKLNLKFSLDFVVKQGGFNISGGERQRLSIVRALLRNSPVILIDEATSQLDAINEYEFRKIIKDILKDKTVLIIAHRLSTVIECDKIFVLKDGTIIAEGRHEELYKKCDFYRNLCDLQFVKV